jgi:hypothetical protein
LHYKPKQKKEKLKEKNKRHEIKKKIYGNKKKDKN